MKSMTGYGVARHKQADLDLEVGVKSVNGRFFELRCHLPREYAGWESEIKKALQAEIRRGTVDVYVQRRKTAVDKDLKVSTDPTLARKWITAYKKLNKDLKLQGDLDMSLLLSRLPEALSVEKSLAASPSEKKTFHQILNQSLQKCLRERKREGGALKVELQDQLNKLSKILKLVENYREEANQKLEGRYRERLEKLGMNADLDPQRLAQEVVVQIDKADICEEITRLREHIRAFKKFMNGKEVQGKSWIFTPRSSYARSTPLVLNLKSHN